MMLMETGGLMEHPDTADELTNQIRNTAAKYHFNALVEGLCCEECELFYTVLRHHCMMTDGFPQDIDPDDLNYNLDLYDPAEIN